MPSAKALPEAARSIAQRELLAADRVIDHRDQTHPEATPDDCFNAGLQIEERMSRNIARITIDKRIADAASSGRPYTADEIATMKAPRRTTDDWLQRST
jgi:hypothetical protein